MPLLAELKRRNVFKVSVAYLALGWVVTEVSNTIVPLLNLPQSIPATLLWIGLAGFPFVVIFSWVYELTPEGLKRESEVDRSQSITHVTSKRLDYIIIAMLAVAMLMFAVDRLFPGDAGADPVRDSSLDAEPNADRGQGLKDRGQGPLPQQEQSAAPDEKSIAVLPFVNMSSDKEQEYFSDGISEELLNLLAKIPELKVTSRSSAFSFKGEKIDIADVAKKLNVAHILEGSVRKSGNTVRITTQLIDTRSDTHLWSETYDRTLEDIFAVQDEIAAAVVTQLKIKLLGAAPKVKAVDPQAYTLYLQGRQLAGQRTAESYTQALALYQQALAIDPGYAEAWMGLSKVYANQVGDGLRPIEEGYGLAREAVDKALALDPDLASAHATLGRVAMSYDRDFAAAARHLTHALSLTPEDPDVLRVASTLAQNLGRVDTAVTILEALSARDPVNTAVHANLGNAYFNAGRPDAAIESFRTALALSPGYSSGHYGIGVGLLQKGEPQAALAEMQQDQEAGSWGQIGLPMAWHAQGEAEKSDAALAELIRDQEKVAAYNIAYVYGYRGDADRAFEWLDKAVAYQDPGLSEIVLQPEFANIHKDSRWLPFLRKLGKAPEQLAAIELEVKLPQQ